MKLLCFTLSDVFAFPNYKTKRNFFSLNEWDLNFLMVFCALFLSVFPILWSLSMLLVIFSLDIPVSLNVPTTHFWSLFKFSFSSLHNPVRTTKGLLEYISISSVFAVSCSWRTDVAWLGDINILAWLYILDYIYIGLFDGYSWNCSLMVSDLHPETNGSRFESGCYLCAAVSSLQ